MLSPLLSTLRQLDSVQSLRTGLIYKQSYAGLFKTAVLHRNALVRVLTLRGNGDVLKGLQSAPPWTIKTVQWCEIMVAMQLVEVSKIPYLTSIPAVPAPIQVTDETTLRTDRTLKSLPHLSKPLHNIIRHLHYLGIAFEQPPSPTKIDDYIKQPLYDAEYTILQVLSAQKAVDHGFPEIEVLLAEAFHLYLWIGPRTLPPQTRLCDLLIPRLMKALLPFLLETVPDVNMEIMPATLALAQQETKSLLASITGCAPFPSQHSTETNNAITWSLMLGTSASSVLGRPEHSWFKEQLGLQLCAMGLDGNEELYQDFLKIFPATDAFPWFQLGTLFKEFQIKEV